MNKRQFLKERRDAWKRFAILIDRIDRVSFKKLRVSEIAEFSRLFRELSNDLAIIRSRAWGQGLVSYLNDLVARGHNAFYRDPPGGSQRVVQFLAADFPCTLRRNFGYFLAAAALFFVPGGITWATIQSDPSLASRILPDEALEAYDQMYSSGEDGDPAAEAKPEAEARESDDEGEDPWSGGFGAERGAMAGFYVQHNVGIALECFARGILLGALTVYTLLYNGIAIGGVGGYVVAMGHSEKFLSFVVSHGSFELTAIAVAGGGGLILGDALLHPGQRTRLESLRTRGFEAVQLALGAAAMLTVAALIEGFWSPAPIPSAVKYAVGGVLWLLVFLYLGFAGRR